MDFEEFFGPNAEVVDLQARDRWQAIDELMDHLVATHKIPAEHRDAIAACLRKRETAMSTGIGFGIGLPHARTDLVPEVVHMIGRSRPGIPFDAIDGKPVHLVFLFLVPLGEVQKHIHTLANLAKLLHGRDFRDGLWGRFLGGEPEE